MNVYLSMIGFCLVSTGLVSTSVSGLDPTEESDPAETNIPPTYTLNDTKGNPCLLASLNITLKISYQAQSGILNQVYDKVVDIDLGDDGEASGQCGDSKTAFLSIQWWDGIFKLNFTFQSEVKSVSQGLEKGRWKISELSVSYDTSNSSLFPEAIQGGPQEFTRDQVSLFSTPLGLSFLCNSPQKILLGNSLSGAELIFTNVRIQPFFVKSERFSGAHECDSDVEVILVRQGEYLIPIIVACCLAAIVGLVIAGYGISRKVNKHTDQTGYRPMD